MANNIYFSKTVLTGGAAGALDSIDGDSLTDGDFAFVCASSVFYLFKLDAASGLAESSPNVIAPDVNAGDKRWILQKAYAPDYILGTLLNASTILGATVDNTPAALTISQILNFLGTPAEGDMPYYGSGGWKLKGVPTYMIVVDEKAAGTDGGTFTPGAWRTRDLNTTRYNTISGASLNSNQITLPAGTYLSYGYAPGEGVNNHVSRLYNTTGEAVLINGTSERSNNSYASCTKSMVIGTFTLSVQSVIELQHYCQTTMNTSGFGVANNYGAKEVYSILSITKIA